MAFEKIFLSVFLDSSLAMMGKTQQGGRFMTAITMICTVCGAAVLSRGILRLLDVIDGQAR